MIKKWWKVGIPVVLALVLIFGSLTAHPGNDRVRDIVANEGATFGAAVDIISATGVSNAIALKIGEETGNKSFRLYWQIVTNEAIIQTGGRAYPIILDASEVKLNTTGNTPVTFGTGNTTIGGDVLISKKNLYITDGTGADSITIYDDGTNAIIRPENTLAIDSEVNYAADSQGDDDYEVTIPGITALHEGLTITFKANTLNTDGATLEITSVGDLDAILKMNDQALVTGDIEAAQIVVVVFDGANWQMTSQLAQ